MKYILTEKQLNLIQEQWWNDPKHPEWKKYAPTNYEKQELKKSETILNNLDPHTLMTVLAIGTAFIPVVGPFISAGIGLADAAMYYKEGDKTSAGVTAAFSMIPFIGKVGNDRLINNIDGPEITIHLDLPMRLTSGLTSFIIVKHKDIKQLLKEF